MRKSNQPSALIHLIGSLALVASSQAFAALASSAVTVSHGWVTDYYLSHWEDPNLPVGVLRGLGPRDQDMTTQSPELDQSETDGLEASRSDETTAPGGHTAILYTLDLNERGMQMVVSTKTTLQPGDCAALERTEEVINLRRVSPAFCDPAQPGDCYAPFIAQYRASRSLHCFARSRRNSTDNAYCSGEVGRVSDAV